MPLKCLDQADVEVFGPDSGPGHRLVERQQHATGSEVRGEEAVDVEDVGGRTGGQIGLQLLGVLLGDRLPHDPDVGELRLEILEHRPRAGRARGRLARGRAAARSGWLMRWRRTCAPSAGEIKTGGGSSRSTSSPAAGATLLDVTPRQLAAIAGTRCPAATAAARALPLRAGRVQGRLGARRARSPGARPRSPAPATVHLGGTLEEIAASEARSGAASTPSGRSCCSRSRACSTRRRAPAGKHTAWAYCHVPNGSTVDMTERIEAQIERFAPGFRDRILARAASWARPRSSGDNANYIGGDINGGVQDLRQLFTRPVVAPTPYTTPVRGSTSARPRRHPVAASTACAATSRRASALRDTPLG